MQPPITEGQSERGLFDSVKDSFNTPEKVAHYVDELEHGPIPGEQALSLAGNSSLSCLL